MLISGESRKGTTSKWYHPFPKKNAERSKPRGDLPAHGIKPLGLEDSPTSDSLSAVGTSLPSASTPDSVASSGSGEKSKPIQVDRHPDSKPQRREAIGLDPEPSNVSDIAGGTISEGFALGVDKERVSSGQQQEHPTLPTRVSWDVAAAESQGIMSLSRGMRVLCLDIFNSKINSGEIRRWRPGEIAEMFTGRSDELMVRVEFSSYGDRKDSVCLCLQDEWTRLAPALSLTEEEMSTGAPLDGDALRDSEKLFKPRYDRRKSRQTDSEPAGAAPKSTVSKTKANASDVEKRVSSRATKAGIGATDGGVRRSESSHRGDHEARRSSSSRRQTGSGSGGGGESGGIDGGSVNFRRGETQSVVQMKTELVREAVRAAIIAAKENKSIGSSGGSSSSIDSSGSGNSGGEKGKRDDKGGEEGEERTSEKEEKALACPTRRSLSLPEMGLPSPETRTSRDAPGGASSGVAPRGGVVMGDVEERRGASTSPPKSRRHHLPGGSDSASGSGSSSGVVPGGTGRGQLGGEGSSGGKGIADAGLEDSNWRNKQWTAWDMSSTKLPSVGDRFDCLDYFISSQTHRRVSRWREAEVAELKRTVMDTIGGRGYEVEVIVLVHYVRWNEKWDRWISFTRHRERFAPYKTHSVPSGDSGNATASPGATEKPQYGKRRNGALGSKSKSSSSSSSHTGTMHDSSSLVATSYYRTGYYNGGYPGNLVGYGVYPPPPQGFHDATYGAVYGATAWQQLQQQALYQSQFQRLAHLSGRPLYGDVGGSGSIVSSGGMRSDSHSTFGGTSSSYNNQSKSVGSSSVRSGGSIRSTTSRSSGSSSGSGSGVSSSSSRRMSAAARVGRREKVAGDGAMRSPAASSHDSEAALDAAFREAMRRKGLSVVDVEPDGNCLFRSVSHQMYGDVDRHHQVRKACVDHMVKHKARFGVFVAESFRKYLRRISQLGIWGDDLEIRAMEEMFDRPIEIYSSEAEDLRPMKIDFDAAALDEEITPIKLSYHGQSHYNSVEDSSISYPLQPRRSKTILRIREAQHARTPRSSAGGAAGSSTVVGRAGGGRLGRGFGTEAASRRFSKDPPQNSPGLEKNAPLPGESSSRMPGAKLTPGSSSRRRGGTNRGGTKVEGEGKGSTRNFSGMALRLFGGNGTSS